MPRSVTHHLTGPLAGVQLRVWERHAEGSMHAIAEGTYSYRCPAGNEHAIAIKSRWDIPADARPWHGLASRARDHNENAAFELGDEMVQDAVHTAWDDPCENPGRS